MYVLLRQVARGEAMHRFEAHAFRVLDRIANRPLHILELPKAEWLAAAALWHFNCIDLTTDDHWVATRKGRQLRERRWMTRED